MKAANKKFWILWLVITLTIVGLLSVLMFNEDTDRTPLMPGPMTDGHHQIGVACATCHTDDFGDKSSMQQACVDCHGDQRKKPFDSHPKAKFTDPRNADTLANIDALHCITCHVEHKPEITDNTGMTQPQDFCIHCHEGIAEERPSHEGMPFDTCATAGCHNFHNNRALYTDFLVKHLHEPAVLENPVLPKREFGDILDQLAEYPRDRYPVQALTQADADAPESAQTEAALAHWLDTAHAQSGVNCSACHVVPEDMGGSGQWTDHPGGAACAQCHAVESDHFQQGKHGMRLKAGLSPMKPSLARLPMKADSVDKELDCVVCHDAHDFNVQTAAVDACLSCHDDQHSLAYLDSPHYELWQKEVEGEMPEGTGVSCASCHMPREDMDVSEWMSRVVVHHNQNATLTPNEKMMRPACLNCHGLEFSINALADRPLIDNNFNGLPTFKTDSMKLAEDDLLRHEKRSEEP